MKKILVPLDGSKASVAALEEAVTMARAEKDKLYVISVTLEVAALSAYNTVQYTHDLVDFERRQAQKMIDAEIANVGYEGEVETRVLSGNPAGEIIRFAEDHDIDVIVMGNRGLGAFSRTILGSVSGKVINGAPCSVYVVKSHHD